MGKIIDLKNYRAKVSAITDNKTMLSHKEAVKIEQIRDSIEVALEEVATTENMPLTVAMAAGRYAAMRRGEEGAVADTVEARPAVEVGRVGSVARRLQS